MMAGNQIVVPAYQRAYSWDTPQEGSDKKTQTDVFLSDLEEYSKSSTGSSYYFGHFLFEERENEFNVIDGQQRLTTIVIFLSALFSKLKSIRSLDTEEESCYEDMIKERSIIRFSTVDYDNQLFKDYVIEQTKHDDNRFGTESSKRIVKAFDFFKNHFSDKPEDYLTNMLTIVSKATCTTHLVQSESEAIQMFIFQNSRGKKPSNLEIVKAQFMHHIHLHGEDEHEVKALLKEIEIRFEEIYKSISLIENKINEDSVLLYTLRVYFHSLAEKNSLDRINKELAGENQLDLSSRFHNRSRLVLRNYQSSMAKMKKTILPFILLLR